MDKNQALVVFEKEKRKRLWKK